MTDIAAAGSTLVLKQADLFDRNLRNSCKALSRNSQVPIHANIYYTPPARKGFRVHFDFHDTIIWQISGAKRWSLWPFPLPPEGRVNDVHVISRACRVRTREKLVLEPGSALQIPAGLIHSANATKLGSIHVTFGVYRKNFCFYWLEMLKELAKSGPRERKTAVALLEVIRKKTAAQATLPLQVMYELDELISSKLRQYVLRGA